MSTRTNVVLIACGAFNPPTHMHFRIFEIARDHLQKLGQYNVVGGIVSPVHDRYGKKDLAAATHRAAMVRLALQDSDWIRLSDWEMQQEEWTRTRLVLQYHQNQLNSHVNCNESSGKRMNKEDVSWIPDNVNWGTGGPIQVKLLCGADLLESFGIPGLWTEEDIDTIVGQHGLVVITRQGSNPYQFIYESDLLTKYQANICIVTEWITNDVSSTKVRRALRRADSVKYLVQDSVIRYAGSHGLYGAGDNKYLFPIVNNSCFLTPSPTDVNMDSPSPTNGHDPANITYIRVETVKDERYSERISNEENVKRSVNVGYPGQAIQIIATANGDKVTSSKVSPTECRDSVPSVQIQITKDGIKVISDRETNV